MNNNWLDIAKQIQAIAQAGLEFTSEFRILPSGGFVIYGAHTVTFERTPDIDETWTVRIGGIDYSVDVTVATTQAQIASAFAGLINADTDEDEGADWSATTYEDTLIIISQSGEACDGITSCHENRIIRASLITLS